MIIGLTGYAQSGKDTVAKILVEHHGFIRIAFADRIRDLLFESNPMFDSIAGEPKFLKDYVTRYGWEEAKKNPQIRRILQTTGVGARKVFGEDFWIEQGIRQIDDVNNYVFTDVRFINEAEAIKSYEDSQIWRIKRLGIDAVNAHVSETQMDGYPVDQIFANNGTVEDLELMVKTRMLNHAKSA
jgi:hypothetical protein